MYYTYGGVMDPSKKKTMLIVGMLAVAVVVIAIIVYFVMKNPDASEQSSKIYKNNNFVPRQAPVKIPLPEHTVIKSYPYNKSNEAITYCANNKECQGYMFSDSGLPIITIKDMDNSKIENDANSSLYYFYKDK
jgi:hypothetical protein